LKNLKKPPWLKKRIPPYQDLLKVKSILAATDLHTVCEEARCPNLGECFSRGTATFLILGNICTRNCGFCAVEHGDPVPADEKEAEKVAQAVEKMGLRYVVVTSVTRDDLPDGGASHYAKTIQAIREVDGSAKVEVLIPDFQGDPSSLAMVLDASPDVLNHNIETVPRLYSKVRPQADYERSLRLLKRSKEYNLHLFTPLEIMPRCSAAGLGFRIIPAGFNAPLEFLTGFTKSGFMLGLGEMREEVLDLMENLRQVKCDFLTIGQYLQPRPDRLPVVRFIPPEEFEEYKRIGEEMGFKAVASGPFVRSSFHASEMYDRRRMTDKK